LFSPAVSSLSLLGGHGIPDLSISATPLTDAGLCTVIVVQHLFLVLSLFYAVRTLSDRFPVRVLVALVFAPIWHPVGLANHTFILRVFSHFCGWFDRTLSVCPEIFGARIFVVLEKRKSKSERQPGVLSNRQI
jgi:hypothetical protein